MTSGETNPAHGGRLIDLIVGGEEAKSTVAEAFQPRSRPGKAELRGC
jgi:hypothetical protein